MSTENEIVGTVRDVVARYGRLAVDARALLGPESLYAAGMTSHASVDVMLGVEDEFDLEFPEEMLTRETFETIDSICAAVRVLGAQM